ncbi:MAG TPA: hypothetical protein VF246_02660 [Acidimicrobiia bacterium]
MVDDVVAIEDEVLGIELLVIDGAVVVVVDPSRQWLMVSTLSLSIQWIPFGHGRCSEPLPVHTCRSLKALVGSMSGVS